MVQGPVSLSIIYGHTPDGRIINCTGSKNSIIISITLFIAGVDSNDENHENQDGFGLLQLADKKAIRVIQI